MLKIYLKLFCQKNFNTRKRFLKFSFIVLSVFFLNTQALAQNDMVSIPIFSGGLVIGATGIYFVPSPTARTTYASLNAINFTTQQTGIFNLASDEALPPFVSGRITRNLPLALQQSLETNPGYRWGFGVQLGYEFCGTGNDVMLNGNYLNTGNTVNNHGTGLIFMTSEPITPIPDTTFGTGTATRNAQGTYIAPFIGTTDLVTGLTTELGNISPFSSATARKNMQWNEVDLDFGQHVNIGGNFDLRLAGGLAWTKIQNQLAVYYAGATINNASASVNVGGSITSRTINERLYSSSLIQEESTFKGLGPELGMDGHYCFTNSSFGLAGHLGVQMLLGNIDSNLQFLTDNIGSQTITTSVPDESGVVVTQIINNNTGRVSNGFGDKQNNRLIPEIDASLGIDYAYNFSNDSESTFVTEVGYQARKYFNVVRNFEDLTGSHLDSGDIFFHGPFLTIKFLA